MTMMVWLCCLFGVVVGAIGRFIVPTRYGGGWWASMLLGALGALLAIGFASAHWDLDDRANETTVFFCALLGSIVFVGSFHVINRD